MAKSSNTKSPPQVEFNFIKSNWFRVVHADGAIGGLSPQGNIHMALYNERRAIPTKVVHLVDAQSKLGAEVSSAREGRKGMVREVEVDVILGIDEAQALHTWLGQKISEHKKVFSPAPERTSKRKKS